jgi:hypothetical protein
MEKGKALVLVILLVITIGLIPTIKLLIDVLIVFNEAIFAVLNESILSFIFKHKITFYLVGLILSGVTSFFGIKLGSDVGKFIYAIVVIGVAGMLNFLMMIITTFF